MQTEPAGKAKFYKEIAELLINDKKEEALKHAIKVTNLDSDEINDFLEAFAPDAKEILNTINHLFQTLENPYSSDDVFKSLDNFSDSFEEFTNLMVEKFDVDFDLDEDLYGKKSLRKKALDELLSTPYEELYKLGKPKTFSDATETQISIEIIHFKLDEKKTFSCPVTEESGEYITGKVESQISEWNQRYFMSKGKEIANKAREPLLKIIVEHETILHSFLQRKIVSVWDYLKDLNAFANSAELSLTPPDKPQLLSAPAEPSRSDKKYQVETGLVGKLFGGRSSKKQELKAEEAFLADLERWQTEKERINRHNLELKAKYTTDMNAFAENNNSPEKHLETIKKIKESYLNNNPKAIVDYCQMVIALSSFPVDYPCQDDLEYLIDDKTVVVDYLMPGDNYLPKVKALEFYYIRDEDNIEDDDFDFEDQYLSKRERMKLHKGVYIQIALSIMYELFRRDEAQAIDSIILNGWFEVFNIDNKQNERINLISIKAEKKSFNELDIDATSPQSCFEHLGGRIKFTADEIHPIEPFATIGKSNQGHSFAEKAIWIENLCNQAKAEMQRIRKSIDKKSEILTDFSEVISDPSTENYQWTNKLWEWADKNNISENDIPRKRIPLIELSFLDLSDYPEITEIPNEIGNLHNLTILEISDCNITTLPSEFGNLSSLQTLYLPSNKLVALPDEIGNLTSLQTLNCRSNKLLKIPSSIGRLHNLEDINFGDNEILEIPQEIRSLEYLQELNLSDNKLREIPEELCRLTELTTLDLQGNFLLKIPSSIGKLHNLEYINLADNKILEIPQEIRSLEYLQELNLSNNKLREIPEELYRLTELTKLYLHGNFLHTISDEISKLIKLEDLDVSNNPLHVLPLEITHLKELKSLYVSRNRLTEIPAEILKLEWEDFDQLDNENDLNDDDDNFLHIESFDLDEYREEDELCEVSELREQIIFEDDLAEFRTIKYEFDVKNLKEEPLPLAYRTFFLDKDGYIVNNNGQIFDDECYILDKDENGYVLGNNEDGFELGGSGDTDMDCIINLKPLEMTSKTFTITFFYNNDRPIASSRLEIIKHECYW